MERLLNFDSMEFLAGQVVRMAARAVGCLMIRLREITRGSLVQRL